MKKKGNRTIKQNEEKIRCSVSSGSSVLAKIISRPRVKIMEKMEQLLTVWIERRFEKFKKRHSLHNLKIHGERASADADAANKYSEEFTKIIKEYDYLPDQIFNANETSLWWKKCRQELFFRKTEKQLLA
ncbi:hypothetical protein GQX74_012908 [Glossina fuscipes]|nr:hypothetical protein GQX74_012908 [Glossina fuscipes]